MKKFFEKVGQIVLGVIGICVIGSIFLFSFKSSFFHSVYDDIDRKNEELEDKDKASYNKMSVWADSSTMYYHSDVNCKGVHDAFTEEMPLYKAEQEGYEECNFCW